MEESKDNFCFVRSSDLHTKIKIKIGTLQGNKKKVDYKMLLDQPMLKFSGMHQKECADLMIMCQVFADGQPLTLPVRTSYKAFTNRWNWNETVTLPVSFSDLPHNAQLALTIYDCAGPSCMYAVGGTTISLFGKHGSFREGMYDLKVWPDREADGNFPSTTSGKECDNGKRQKQRLSKLAKEHSINNIKNVDWLDRLVFREIHLINEKEKRVSNCMYLMLEFPKVVLDEVSYTVVFHEENKDTLQYPVPTEKGIVTIPDHEILQENLVESKHHKLARSVRSGISDKDAKPNANLRDVLNTIIAYPPTKQLSAEEQDLVWKYRFYLSKEKKALTKFLKCVNWKVCSEATHALDVLKIWTPMDVEDALELLGPTFSYPLVRHYAVTRLQQAPDEDLLLYLLQLVQALKYENFDKIKEAYRKLCPDHSAPDVTDSWSKENKESIDLIMKKSHSCSTNGSADVEEASGTHETRCNSFEGQMSENDKLPQHSTNEFNECDLATFLIQRACENSILANYFYWYLLIECEDQEPAVKQDTKVRNMYLTVLKTFSQSLLKGNAEWQKRRIFLYRQLSFIDKLVKLIKTVARESGSRLKKTERLQALLANSEDFKINFANFEPLPFPLDPDVVIKGIVPEKASLFKSALMPSRLTFLTTDNTEYVAIFKNGDDLRQDQLILQMITLMDKLLRRENLDLKLTPYRVLATSTRHGFVQFIDSLPVQEILTAEGSILNFFRKHNPSETGPYGIAPEVMDTYVKSCAGYCVITYLLGVGDRHLENLLLTTSGKLFHIDFGYILGRDPKPLPPPMKLTKEMVEAMGGVQAEHYHIFRQQCYTAFLHLRRHANLMLNLFSLMVDASVPDIALEPDKAVKKVQDKLRLDLCDEEAVQCIHTLLDDSTSAVMPVLVEHLHKFTQYLRK